MIRLFLFFFGHKGYLNYQTSRINRKSTKHSRIEYFSTISYHVEMNETTCVKTYGINGTEFEKFLLEPSCHAYTSIIVFFGAMSISRFG